jgi:histidinol-phosphate aminotransferase
MRDIWRPVLGSITPYQPGKSLEALASQLALPELIRLSANENPLGPSPRVVATIAREASRVHLYPDGGSTALRKALGHRLGLSPEQILVGNGADELLTLLGLAALEQGDEVLLPLPSFEAYATIALLGGARPVASPLIGYDTDLDDMRRRITPRTKIVFVCSPHNPAGTIVSRRALTAFLESLADDPPLIVLDEAYRDFCDDPEYPDGVVLLARYPRLVVLRTFSKIAGLAGLRVGYVLASPQAIDRLDRVRAPYNVNRLGQVAAVAALEDEDHWHKSRQLVIEERAFLSQELVRRGFRFPPSQANFMLVKVPDGALARERLLRAGLVVRDGAALGFANHLRISIGLRETNERLLAVLDSLPR